MESLSGRRIALIGGAGFIGHNLALALKRLGAEPFVIDSLGVNNYYSIKEGADDVPNAALYLNIIEERLQLLRESGIRLIEVDSRDYHRLSAAMSQVDADAVVHLAAVAHAGKSNKDPDLTFDHSLRTLENALDVARSPRLGIKHFVYFSSSMVYGNFIDGVVTEESPCEPLGIYGALKFAGEMVIAYNQVFNLPYTIVRPSALYGERCVSRRVGQIFIENALQGLDISINGDGSDRLDFTYIGDLVHGIVCVLTHEAACGQIFNLTYGQSRGIAEMAQILQSHFPSAKINYLPKDNLTPSRGTLSVEKAKRLIGYDPQCPLEKGFVDYIRWYQAVWAKLREPGNVDPARTEPDPLAKDEWLSRVLGKNAYSLTSTDALSSAASGSASRAYSKFREIQSKPCFITAKTSVDDLRAIAFLEEHGFTLIDTNVRLEKPIDKTSTRTSEIEVRFARESDREAVVRLARTGFHLSRFHRDATIPKETANDVKARWADNFFAGKRGDRMVAALKSGEVVGFTQLIDQPETAVVDLIAVAEQHRRQGVAAAMLGFVEANSSSRSIAVGTQACNTASIRLYENLGFRWTAAQYVFHFHNPRTPL